MKAILNMKILIEFQQNGGLCVKKFLRFGERGKSEIPAGA